MAELRLEKSLAAWGTPEFRDVLKAEIEALGVSQLPLVHAMTGGSVPLEGSIETMILDVSEINDSIHIKAGIFFKSIIAGCACANDPTPENENNEYCELMLEINRASSEALVDLISE